MHGECAANEADVCAKFYRVIRNVFDDDELTVPRALTGHDTCACTRPRSRAERTLASSLCASRFTPTAIANRHALRAVLIHERSSGSSCILRSRVAVASAC
jgi:hypothetical protein